MRRKGTDRGRRRRGGERVVGGKREGGEGRERKGRRGEERECLLLNGGLVTPLFCSTVQCVMQQCNCTD